MESRLATRSSWAGTEFICLERSVLSSVGPWVRRLPRSWGPGMLPEGLVGVGRMACSMAGFWPVSSGHLGRYQAGWPIPKSSSQSRL